MTGMAMVHHTLGRLGRMITEEGLETDCGRGVATDSTVCSMLSDEVSCSVLHHHLDLLLNTFGHVKGTLGFSFLATGSVVGIGGILDATISRERCPVVCCSEVIFHLRDGTGVEGSIADLL